MSEVDPSDHDFVMSIQDGLERTKTIRTIVDMVLLFTTAGFWIGFMAIELFSHHSKIKRENDSRTQMVIASIGIYSDFYGVKYEQYVEEEAFIKKSRIPPNPDG